MRRSASGRTVWASTCRTTGAEAQRLLDLNGGDFSAAIEAAKRAAYVGKDRYYRQDVIGWLEDWAG